MLKTASIDSHIYQLAFSNDYLGSIAHSSTREGALLRIKFIDYPHYGYACIHPWQELGDSSLESQLSSLKSFNTQKDTALISQALHCAYSDAQARSKKQALRISPHLENHALCELSNPNLTSILREKQKIGFEYIKIKVGNNWEKEKSLWQNYSQQFPELKWRLDFNERLDRKTFEETLAWLDKSDMTKHVDFFEDPLCPQLNKQFLISYQGPIKLAIDRKLDLLPHFNPHYFNGIAKPAIDNPELINSLLQSQFSLCFTSYLDHPLGQTWAAHQASYWQEKYPTQILPSGLLSHTSYQPNSFSSQLSSSPYWKESNHLNSISRLGLGFDTLLTALTWKPLNY